MYMQAYQNNVKLHKLALVTDDFLTTVFCLKGAGGCD